MSVPLAIAAALAVVIGAAHSSLGERFILIRLFRRDELPRLFGSDWFTRRTLRFAWHLTTVAWWGLAAVLLVLGVEETPAEVKVVKTVRVIGWTFAVSAVIAFAASRGRHLSWIVFGGIAIACLATVGLS
ncbi:MAG: hypothetical protein AAF533_05655 [Acidobacteriota bacterium]